MAKKSGGLGRGLYEIFEDNVMTAEKGPAQLLRLSEIEPRKDQPRKDFNREALESLADSISNLGVLQPIVVRENKEVPGTYEIVAGERRWRAAKMAGLSEIPAVVLDDSDDKKTAQVALIENLQRENLNALEEAQAYEALMSRFALTQEQIAKQVGKSRSAIANTLRLLDLPDAVALQVKEGTLSAGHARALLALDKAEDMETVAERVIAKELSVRETEMLVKKLLAHAESVDMIEADSEKGLAKLTRIHMKELERRSQSTLGRRVRITNTGKKKTVELSFENNEDLEALLKVLCGNDFFNDENF